MTTVSPATVSPATVRGLRANAAQALALADASRARVAPLLAAAQALTVPSASLLAAPVLETLEGLQGQLDASRGLLGWIAQQGTAQDTRHALERLTARNRALAARNSDLSRRVGNVLAAAERRGGHTLRIVARALDGDTDARAELRQLHGHALADYALALCAELDAHRDAVSNHLDDVAHAVTLAEGLPPAVPAHFPPPRDFLAGSLEGHAPPAAPLCAGQASRGNVHSLHFPARKAALAT